MIEQLNAVTIEDIENHKLISNEELDKDLSNIRNFDVSTNTNSFYGNKFLYHHQMKNLLKCKRENGETIYDVYDNKEKWTKLIESTQKRKRNGRTVAGNVYECHRINTGSIVMFKSTSAKYLYAKYGATKVLDPTAGWGGRMLGAWALDIDYVGIDTNTEMKDAYSDMVDKLDNYGLFKSSSQEMIWESCLTTDFSKIEYDFVLTSPPYINMEVYEHMTQWESDSVFYSGFLLPLFKKCVKHIKQGGKVAFNISPKMYKEAVEFGLPKCDIEEDLLQQMGSSNKKQYKIYIWEA